MKFTAGPRILLLGNDYRHVFGNSMADFLSDSRFVALQSTAVNPELSELVLQLIAVSEASAESDIALAGPIFHF